MCTDIIPFFLFFTEMKNLTSSSAPLHWGNCRVLLPHLKPVSIIIHLRTHKPYGGTRPFYHLLTLARRNSERRQKQEMSMNTGHTWIHPVRLYTTRKAQQARASVNSETAHISLLFQPLNVICIHEDMLMSHILTFCRRRSASNEQLRKNWVLLIFLRTNLGYNAINSVKYSSSSLSEMYFFFGGMEIQYKYLLCSKLWRHLFQ